CHASNSSSGSNLALVTLERTPRARRAAAESTRRTATCAVMTIPQGSSHGASVVAARLRRTMRLAGTERRARADCVRLRPAGACDSAHLRTARARHGGDRAGCDVALALAEVDRLAGVAVRHRHDAREDLHDVAAAARGDRPFGG